RPQDVQRRLVKASLELADVRVRDVRARSELAQRELRELPLRAEKGSEGLELELPGVLHGRPAYAATGGTGAARRRRRPSSRPSSTPSALGPARPVPMRRSAREGTRVARRS